MCANVAALLMDLTEEGDSDITPVEELKMFNSPKVP